MALLILKKRLETFLEDFFRNFLEEFWEKAERKKRIIIIFSREIDKFHPGRLHQRYYDNTITYEVY